MIAFYIQFLVGLGCSSIIVASYVELTSVTHQWRSNIQYFPARFVGLRLNYETYSFDIVPRNGLQGAMAQYAANHNWGHKD